jgi:hypothetical protein
MAAVEEGEEEDEEEEEAAEGAGSKELFVLKTSAPIIPKLTAGLNPRVLSMFLTCLRLSLLSL